jgi:hypothetical protein
MQDVERRLDVARIRLNALRDSVTRARERYDVALNQLRSYGYKNLEEAKEGYTRLVAEIPFMEEKLKTLLDKAEEGVEKAERSIGGIEGCVVGIKHHRTPRGQRVGRE